MTRPRPISANGIRKHAQKCLDESSKRLQAIEVMCSVGVFITLFIIITRIAHRYRLSSFFWGGGGGTSPKPISQDTINEVCVGESNIGGGHVPPVLLHLRTQ